MWSKIVNLSRTRTGKVSLAVVTLIVLFATLSASRSAAPRYRTVPLARGDLVVDISATGTLQPEEAIDVGAQVAGQIVSLGTDVHGNPIDYGSEVEEGMILARIDQALYESDVAQAEAQLKRAEADLTQLKARLLQAERDWKRAQKLGPSDALAQSEYDSYQAAYETAKANVTVGEAAIVQAQATLSRAQRNLAYTVISSPVKGVIIDRRVNVGQTVVSSLNAPSLFLIAKDLRRMEVWVSVNEADIGSIYPGQPVTFTVDAFPGEVFTGTVDKVRLNASMTQNVVTYVVEVQTDNSNGRLLPYLTANVRFEVSNRKNVLLAPNAALRFVPQGQQRPTDLSGDQGLVWVLRGARPTPVTVHRLVSDGAFTEIESPDLREGDLLVVGQQLEEGGGASGGQNPFGPPQFRRGGRG